MPWRESTAKSDPSCLSPVCVWRASCLASELGPPPTTAHYTLMQDPDAQCLYRCLRAMFVNAEQFGGSLFALAASVVTDLIHHDPLCYRTLDEAGLPEAFLAAVKVGGLGRTGRAFCVVRWGQALSGNKCRKWRGCSPP